YSMFAAISEGGAADAVFGSSTGMPLVVGIGLVIGSFVSGGTATPNFTRFARTPLSAVITTVIAFFLWRSLMVSFRCVGGACTGEDDIRYVMIGQGLAIRALIVLGANSWTTNNSALYTTGLGYANVTKINKKPLVLIAGAIGTIGSLWLYDNCIGWLNFLNATLPPIGGIIIADYVTNRRAYDPTPPPQRTVVCGGLD